MGLLDYFKRKPSQETKVQASGNATTKQEQTIASSPAKQSMSLKERYGKASLNAYKSGDWSEAVRVPEIRR